MQQHLADLRDVALLVVGDALNVPLEVWANPKSKEICLRHKRNIAVLWAANKIRTFDNNVAVVIYCDV